MQLSYLRVKYSKHNLNSEFPEVCCSFYQRHQKSKSKFRSWKHIIKFDIIKSSFSKILCLQGACQELSVLLLHCQVKHPSTWTIIQFCKTLQACKSQAQRYLSFLFTRLYWTFAEKSWLCAVWWSAHQKRRRPSSLWPLIHQDIQVLAEIIHFDRPCHRCSMGACPLFCTFGVSKKKCTKPKKSSVPNWNTFVDKQSNFCKKH